VVIVAPLTAEASKVNAIEFGAGTMIDFVESLGSGIVVIVGILEV
jgi:hypothetical protein